MSTWWPTAVARTACSPTTPCASYTAAAAALDASRTASPSGGAPGSPSPASRPARSRHEPSRADPAGRYTAATASSRSSSCGADPPELSWPPVRNTTPANGSLTATARIAPTWCDRSNGSSSAPTGAPTATRRRRRPTSSPTCSTSGLGCVSSTSERDAGGPACTWRFGTDLAVLSDVPLEGLRTARARAETEGVTDRVAVVVSSTRAVPFRAETFDAVVHTDVLC